MQHIASQWGLQLIFRMHNSDPPPQGVENRNIFESGVKHLTSNGQMTIKRLCM